MPPIDDADDIEDRNAGDDAATSGDDAATRDDKAADDAGGGSDDKGGDDSPYAALSGDAATRAWLEKQGLDSPAKLATKAYELEKLVGGRVKVPGKDATDEERKAFAKAIGVPDDKEGYAFDVPKNLPADLPYDEGAATEFKGVAHEIGLTPGQAAKLHDWFVGQRVNDFNSALEAAPEQVKAVAEAETAKLTKVWGPLNSDTGKRNAALADKALSAFPPTFISSLQKAGMVGPNKEILNADLGIGMAHLGAAVYSEDDVLRGNPAAVGNPFDEGSPHFNLTKAMSIIKSDPEQAKTLIYAAGKTPADYGLKA